MHIVQHRSQADPARMNLRNMHVFNPQGSMNTTEWRIAGELEAPTHNAQPHQIPAAIRV